MRIIETKNHEYKEVLKSVLGRGESDSASVEAVVREIIANVKKRGDSALFEYTKRFDRADIGPKTIKVSEKEINAAIRKIPKKDLAIIELSASRISSFHKRQIEFSWFYNEDEILLGQKISAIEKAGIYVPGGKAAYPSTVLMNAIPAKVAGVKKVVMVTPPGPTGEINPYVLAAAKVAKVDAIFKIGGAQAVAALAYGTKSVPKVDKIVGPGNIYVATAKRLVFGTVDIDMVAGPSEILVINDGTGSADVIAADLLSQAEHDELASSILITTSKAMAKKVALRVGARIKKLKRRAIAEKSIASYGVIFVTGNLNEAFSISNSIAPEHLELFMQDAEKYLKKVENAGAVFLGPDTAEACGDYIAGPNHTLPTGGTARFSSPLGVYDFQKRTSVISFSERAARQFGKAVSRFARIEGLEAHALSAEARLGGKKRGR
ncbi:MAG: histidinol dehydrogenase [Deltaproteobacteria bacterium]|nr:histidinol dehydrogenase [Deltaproteobacteria bacterium]